VAQSDHEAGAASVAAIALVVGAVAILPVAGAVSAWSLARSEAAMIADLAALAAARSSACSAAQEVARLHRSTLAECAFDGTDVEVAVTVTTASAWMPTVTRRARSGY
jgi:secretion/DNA translocation related TadE-like protein